jgi:hypothetical protein
VYCHAELVSASVAEHNDEAIDGDIAIDPDPESVRDRMTKMFTR